MSFLLAARRAIPRRVRFALRCGLIAVRCAILPASPPDEVVAPPPRPVTEVIARALASPPARRPSPVPLKPLGDSSERLQLN